MRQINKLIVHCSDSDNLSYGIDQIRKDHILRGFDDIGYHYVIQREGLFIGRDIHLIPASCKGHNRGSVAICLTGRSNFTQGQFNCLKTLVNVLRAMFLITQDNVFNHRDLNPNKTCPNFCIRNLMGYS